jgi:hypothetical protein
MAGKGIIYQNHNFKDNLRNAVKYDDFDALVNTMSCQIGRIAATNKMDLVRIAKDSGLAVTSDMSDEDMFAVISNALFLGNKTLISKIIEYSVDKSSIKYDNVTGIEEAIGAVAEAVGAVAGLGASISNIFAQKEITKGKEVDLKGKHIDQQIAVLNAAALMKQSKDALAIEESRSAAGTRKTALIIGGVTFIFIIGTLAFIGSARRAQKN